MLDKPVLDRVEMDVIHVRTEITLVAHNVLPEAALPYAALAAYPAAFRKRFAGVDRSGKAHFDRLPAFREIAVVLRKGKQAMHMVRQHNPGVDMEWHEVPDAHDSAAKVDNSFHKQVALAVAQVDREEIGGSGKSMAAVIGHKLA